MKQSGLSAPLRGPTVHRFLQCTESHLKENGYCSLPSFLARFLISLFLDSRRSYARNFERYCKLQGIDQ